MKITPDRLAVARAVRDACGLCPVGFDEDDVLGKIIAAIPEPPDDSQDAIIASVPKPPGIGVCCMCDAEIPVACKDCIDYARESVGLPAPDREGRCGVKLSEKRKQAIAGAVYERITRLRIELARSSELTGTKLGEQIDYRIAKAMNDAASAAVRAAGGAE